MAKSHKMEQTVDNVTALTKSAAVAELSGEVAVIKSSQIIMTAKDLLPAGFKLKKILTLPSLNIKTPGEERILRFDEPLHESKVPGKLRADGTRDAPATVAAVTDMQTGAQMMYLSSAVVLKNIRESFPDDSYVGETFLIKNLGRRVAGQSYADFGIAHLEKE